MPELVEGLQRAGEHARSVERSRSARRPRVTRRRPDLLVDMEHEDTALRRIEGRMLAAAVLAEADDRRFRALAADSVCARRPDTARRPCTSWHVGEVSVGRGARAGVRQGRTPRNPVHSSGFVVGDTGSALWSADRLVDVLTEAVSRRRWPAQLAAAALIRVAGDPTTRSPMRLACPGPWWDDVSSVGPAARHDDRQELDRLEARLLEADGRRVWAQQRARADLAERGEALTRLNVAHRACELLDDAELTAC